MSTPATSADRDAVRPTSGRVELADGRRMMVDHYGASGPVVVLLHGIPGWRGTFAEVGVRLGRRCRVLVPDLLGFGDSDDAPKHAHATEHAGFVAGMLKAIGVERFHMVGFDFGGPTAVRLAETAREKVRSLTLMSTNLFPDTPVPVPLRIARVPVLGPAFFRLAFGSLGLSLMWRVAVADRAAFPFRRYREALGGHGVRSTRRIFLASMRDLPGLYADVERASQSLGLPSLVLWGDRDPFFPVEVGRRTAEAVRGDFKIFRGCGHFVPEERSEQVAREVQSLVERTDT